MNAPKQVHERATLAHIRSLTYVHTRTHAHAHTCIHTHTHTCIRTHAYIHAPKYATDGQRLPIQAVQRQNADPDPPPVNDKARPEWQSDRVDGSVRAKWGKDHGNWLP